ncbi:MAG: hypothetical protein FWD26_04535 [Treponema sp.]|nr:hypothetical protein [Treponema sp.]
MNSSHPRYVPADELLEDYVEKEDKFKERFVALFDNMEHYIKESGYQEKVIINPLLLGYMLIDYFEDIRRLKGFHKLDQINTIKIVAYTAYWLLRRKPIQVTAIDKDVVYINEKFVLAYILEHLYLEGKNHILDREDIGLLSFSKNLLYFLKYRFYNAQSLEMLLISFYAGQIYQENDPKKDLSNGLPHCDFES